MAQNRLQLGRHLLIELAVKGNSIEVLDDINAMKNLMLEAVKEVGAEVRDVSFIKFEPQGLSGVVVISESHFSVHTWPEYGTAVLDFFTCGNHNPWKAVNYLIDNLDVCDLVVHEVPRYFPVVV